MLRSMTGYGMGRTSGDELALAIEVRAVNNRHLDVNVRSPRGYLALEEPIRKEVQRRLGRGRVDVFLNVAEAPPPARRVRVNLDLARQYSEALQQLAEELGGDTARLRAAEMARLPDVIEVIADASDADAVWPAVERALAEALDSLIAARRVEGERLQADLLGRLAALETELAGVTGRLPQLEHALLERLRSAVQRLAPGLDLDSSRLEQEVVLQAERGDVTEEIVRLRSHLARFRELAGRPGGDPIGRELDFLVQEMLREIHTLGAKTSDEEVGRRVIAMKAETERIREQVQNVE